MHFSENGNNIICRGSGRNNGFLDCILAGTTRTTSLSDEENIPARGYTFGYVTGGKGILSSEGTACPLTKGSFYYIAKGCCAFITPEISANSPVEEPFDRFWFQMDGTMAEDIVHTFRLGSIFTAKANVQRNFLDIHDKLSILKPENAPHTLQNIACILFEILAALRCQEFFAPTDFTSNTAEAIRGYLDNNIYNDLSLEVLTERFGISKMHIIRLFKKEYGTTPMQYLMDRKISLAKSLLRGTVMPIGEISDLLQFANSQHFSNTFRNTVGVSPNQYRKIAHSLD